MKMKWTTGILKDYDGPLLFGKINTENLLLLNALYAKPLKSNKYEDTGYLVLKDVRTGEKRLMTIRKPSYIYYIVKEGFRDYTHIPSHKPLSVVEPRTARFSQITKDIAEVAGPEMMQLYKQCMKNNFSQASNMHKWPYVLGSDINWNSYARIQWILHYHNPSIDMNVTKSFLDIEVDTINIAGFPEPGQCPINAVTICDEHGGTVYTFLLRTSGNPLIEEFEKKIDSVKEKCHQLFDETYGVMDYRIFMFDMEIDLIASVFSVVNDLKRDFCLIWNMSFDIPYIIARIKELGYDPAEIMCHKDFHDKWVNYRRDMMATDFKKRNDKFSMASYTQFMCQMVNYIKLRKGESEIKNLQLNSIGWKELKDTKIDYSEEANIKTLPYIDYEKFVIYNIKDTLLQMGIERKTKDTDNVFSLALINATPYENAFSQTILLRNYAYMSYFEQGYIIGNNRNTGNQEPQKPLNPLADEDEDNEDTFAGGLVCDPLLNDYVGVVNFGKRSKYIFRDVIDFDYESLYPSIIRSHNINRETMIGKLFVNGFGHLNPNPLDTLYDQGRAFMESYLAKDWTDFGRRYFNLGSTLDILKEIESKEVALDEEHF